MSKKTVLLLSSIALLVTLCSCGKKESTTTSTTKTGSSSTSSEAKSFSLKGKNHQNVTFGDCTFDGNVESFDIVCKKIISTISLMGISSPRININGMTIQKASEYTVKGSMDGVKGHFPLTIVHNDNSLSNLNISIE